MDELKETIKKYFEDRLSGPLFGYLFFAWISFNWKPLAIVFFDKRAMVERIKFVEVTPEISWSLWWPLVIGVLLASASPYLHLGLQYVHSWATNLKREKAVSDSRKRINSERQLSKDKSALRNEDALEDARQDVRKAILLARKERIEKAIPQYIAEAKKLKKEQDDIIAVNKELLAARAKIRKLIDNFAHEMRAAASVENIDELQSRAENFRHLTESMDEVRTDAKLWGELSDLTPQTKAEAYINAINQSNVFR